MLGSLFNIVVGLQVCNYIKKRLQHRFFLPNLRKILKAPFLKKTSANGCFSKSHTRIGLSKENNRKVLSIIISKGSGKGQKQPPAVFYEKSFSQKFCNIRRKTPVLESLFNKVY